MRLFVANVNIINVLRRKTMNKHSLETLKERGRSVLTAKVMCPYCNSEVDVQSVDSLTVKDTTAIKKILDRSFFNHKCSECGKIFAADHSFDLIDEEKSIKIICTLDEMATKEIEHVLLLGYDKNKKHTYRVYRVVNTIGEFREKHLAFSANIDDRIVELIKLDLRLNRCADCGEISEVVFFGSNDNSLFFRAKGSKKAKAIYITWDEYDVFKDRYVGILSDNRDVIIDSSWAVEHQN